MREAKDQASSERFLVSRPRKTNLANKPRTDQPAEGGTDRMAHQASARQTAKQVVEPRYLT